MAEGGKSIMNLTPEQIDEQIDAMPAGKELNALIEELIYQAIPLTDDEAQLLRVAWWTTSPCHAGFTRLFKVPTKEPHPETGAMYRLLWPQDFSTDRQGAEGLVHRMRQDGWLFELYDCSNGLRVVRFIHKESMGKYRSEALAETDALAICRAALKAKLMEAKTNDR